MMDQEQWNKKNIRFWRVQLIIDAAFFLFFVVSALVVFMIGKPDQWLFLTFDILAYAILFFCLIRMTRSDWKCYQAYRKKLL